MTIWGVKFSKLLIDLWNRKICTVGGRDRQCEWNRLPNFNNICWSCKCCTDCAIFDTCQWNGQGERPPLMAEPWQALAHLARFAEVAVLSKGLGSVQGQ